MTKVYKWAALALASLAHGALAAASSASTAERGTFDRLPSGEAVEAVTLTGTNGVSAKIITFGATLQEFNVPDREGRVADITIGHDNIAAYLETPNYWGQTIGRYANRIAGGRFSLDGRNYQLTLNNGVNSLHGGAEGWDMRNWRIVSVDEDGPVASVTLALSSPNGDQGYPGTVNARVTYSLDDRGSLTIAFEATTDAPTIINMTNHALFNLGGEGWPYGTYDQRLTIPASQYLPVDATLIPTGERRGVEGTVFDFRNGRMMYDGVRDGADEQIVLGHGWDHNWILDKGRTARPELAARVEHTLSGRVLEVLSTEPGLQFYSGNFLVGELVGEDNLVFRMGDGIALEPQLFPDTPNQSDFGSARLDPGQTYRHTMIYRVSVAG
ncbi:aldose epimerase family protein [Aurantiacibacter luteus]|uniref:Aldose 1-epimerase n=1 Tax=Aurantiacibacter luteus TaxID=1581420 RepID=A0A0G9N326_9SPHN|nr:aldose epimerase family protein [Aurantiacibacter luteus]KLE35948.1 aldose epimerase [Aurantiacibacter luteus]